jgi:PAS domain S-box-containing protein
MTLTRRWMRCGWRWRSEQAMTDETIKTMGPQASDLKLSSAYIRRLLLRVSWGVPAIVLLLLVLITVTSYQLRAKPIALANAAISQREAADRMGGKIEALASSVDRIVLTTRDWVQSGVLTLDDPAALNRVLIPVILQRTVVSSVHVANDDGREVLLLRVPEGWRNRITDVPRKGKEQAWIVWKDATTKLSEEKKEQDYDPRKRPWFSGVMGVPENQIYWTAPYIFQSTKEPGITASIRWVDRATGKQWVVAFDVLLSDLSRVTLEMAYANHGKVALLATDGKVLGLPRGAGFDNDEAIKKAVLQEAGSIGLPQIAEALKEGHDAQSSPLGARILVGDEMWRVKLQRQALRNQAFQIALLAPESDFAPWSKQLFAGVLTSFALLALLAGWAARRLYRKVAEPVSNLFDQLTQSSLKLAVEGEKDKTLTSMSSEMQKAKDFSQLGDALFSGLAGSLALGQGSLYLADEARQCLVLGAGYARPAGDDLPQEIAYGNGLVGQSCMERLPIRMDDPEEGYLRVSSVLGSGNPKTIVIQPIIMNGELLGVLELATLDSFSKEDQSLLEGVLPILALCLDILTRNLQTEELLVSAQDYAKVLDGQKQSIAENELRIRQLLELSPIGCSIATEEGVSVFRNQRLAQMLGYTLDELAAVNAADYWVSPDDRVRFVEQLKREGSVSDFRSLSKRADGTPITVFLSASYEEIFGGRHIVVWTYNITRLEDGFAKPQSVIDVDSADSSDSK